jgi:hypothetical protein
MHANATAVGVLAGAWLAALVLVLVLLRWEGLVRGSAVARLAATCRLMAQ